MKKGNRNLLLFAILLLLVTSAICYWSINRTIDDDFSGSSSPQEYTVTKYTGLYSAFDIDADMIAELSEGTKVKPATGSTLSCDTITELGTTYELCRVTVVESNKTGWVLRKWIR